MNDRLDIRDLFFMYWQELAKHNNLFDLGMGMPPPDFFDQSLMLNKDLLQGLSERTKYQPQAGNAELREALAQYEEARTGHPCAAENIMLVNGALRGFSLVLDCLVKSTSMLVELIPTYPLLAGYARLMADKTGCKLLTIVPQDQLNYQVQAEELLRFIQPGTILYLTEPSNPTGRYINPTILTLCATACEQVGALMIVDQSCDVPFDYSITRYDWVNSTSVVRLRSFSKDLLLAGFRIGYIVADHRLIELFSNYYAFSEGNATVVTNSAIEHFVRNQELIRSFGSIIENKASYTITQLASTRKVRHIISPEACYYLFFHLDTKFGSWKILETCTQSGINIVPGRLFGLSDSMPWIRICIARKDEDLEYGVDKLCQIINKL